MTALGLDLEADPPAGWIPLDVIVIAKCLNENGEVALFHTTSPSLKTYEAVGLVRWTQLRLETDLAGGEET